MSEEKVAAIVKKEDLHRVNTIMLRGRSRITMPRVAKTLSRGETVSRGQYVGYSIDGTKEIDALDVLLAGRACTQDSKAISEDVPYLVIDMEPAPEPEAKSTPAKRGRGRAASKDEAKEG